MNGSQDKPVVVGIPLIPPPATQAANIFIFNTPATHGKHCCSSHGRVSAVSHPGVYSGLSLPSTSEMLLNLG